ncbi:MAG: ATP phosphoribosyltransferase [Bacillota bacterium]|uniref:ATP phosphoribosyltransferase n=1 Tax=Virgibacillus salarius TaxID=447199 RepID=A0A941DY81_9BACI|nr:MULTISPECIES: ATP phosphoribosyltransferase [Bacillaceae]NAZ10476.1 ATP phosphoribosyltransferase [Agaribacter marinus]MBR7797767.1 ATP phosphoribosyltransferase [Virgibacillus salarius]MCC2252021.1 ATP phosphoribosyltransferase [Virgibacillus sp. AGTR]MDY7046006.1 ATP phosphoribosyltransferase [Virgibacillus sp. M23]QRZ19584.1 ATP phosphoribosyltransferase [Virgibacillus sp. AGTR]
MEAFTLAVAKGRTANQTIHLMKKIGIIFNNFTSSSRKLVFYNSDKTIRLLFVKAVDVPTYVERGAADVGIVGKDNVLESEADVYDILDLRIGQCTFAIAGKPGENLNKEKPITIATKYPTITHNYFSKKGKAIHIVKLNGSVELAPLIGLADAIVDIVETGNTLKENGLVVLEEVEPISTRLIINKASFAIKSTSIQPFIEKLRLGLEE